MKKRFTYFSRKSIRIQILAVSLLISTVISLLAVAVCYTAFSRLLSEKEIRSGEYGLSLAVSTFRSDMDQILSFVKWCQADSDIQNYLQNAGEYRQDPSAKTRFNVSSVQTYEKVNREFFSSGLPYVDRAIISTNDGQYYIHIMAKTIPSNYSPAETVLGLPYFQSYLEAEPCVFDRIEGDILSSQSSRQFLPIIRPIYIRPGEQIGFLYLEISADIFKDLLSDAPFQHPAIVLSGNGYILENDRFVLCSGSPGTLTQKNPSFLGSQSHLLVSNSLFSSKQVLTMDSGFPDLSFSQEIVREPLFSQGSSLYLLTLTAVFILVLAGGFLISHSLKRLIFVPIRSICQKIQEIGNGNFSRRPEIEYTNELGEIGRCINTMSENVVSLMDRKVADEKQKQELEYQILQSQINPHFLYNTLNSIKWMASIQGASGVADMITSLARLMKHVAKAGDALIPLSQEFALLDDYFFIQRHRYGGGVRLVYEIENECLSSCLIHRFSLQPIVENALFHGIEPKGSKGCITIRVTSEEQKRLFISVIDDGIGMTEETIRQALNGTDNARHAFFRQVGIRNVHQRILRSFGPDYGISIQSVPGCYTRMTFTLPYLNEFSPVPSPVTPSL